MPLLQSPQPTNQPTTAGCILLYLRRVSCNASAPVVQPTNQTSNPPSFSFSLSRSNSPISPCLSLRFTDCPPRVQSLRLFDCSSCSSPAPPAPPLILAAIFNVLRAWSQRFSQIRSPHPPALEPRLGPRSLLFNTFVLCSSILNVHRSPPALPQVKEPGLVFDGVGTTPPEGGDRGIASLLELWKL